MKKLMSLLTLVVLSAVVLFTTSCKEDAVVTISSQDNIEVSMTDLETSFLSGTITAQNCNLLLATFAVNFDPALQIGTQTLQTVVFDSIVATQADKKTQFTFSYKLTDLGSDLSLLALYKDNIKSVTINVTATDDGNATKTIPVKFVVNETPLTEMPFIWERIGGAEATGLEQFGLKWLQNVKAVHCIIEPMEGVSLYQVNAADYEAVTTNEALIDLVANSRTLDKYTNVSADATSDYNDVLVTVNGDKYYIIKVAHATVEVASQGTTITITGDYKTKEAVVTSK